MLDVSAITAVIDLCMESNIVPELSFIIGFPEETMADLEMTINLSLLCKTITGGVVFVFILSPFPGSDTTFDNFDFLHLNERTLFEMKSEVSLNETEMIKENKKIFSSYYSFQQYTSEFDSSEIRIFYDFLVIVMEKYPTLFSLMCNKLNQSFVNIYRYFAEDIKELDYSQIYNYEWEISYKQMQSYSKEYLSNELLIDAVSAAYQYDSTVNYVYKKCIDEEQILCAFASRKVLDDSDTFLSTIKSYAILGRAGTVFTIELPEEKNSALQEAYGALEKQEFEQYLLDEFDIEF